MTLVKLYRAGDSITQIDRRVLDMPVGAIVRLTLPEPPTVNTMIGYAKERTRKTRTGGFMKTSLPIVYDQHLERYELEARAALAAAGRRAPFVPWERWAILRVEFRLWSLRDKVELMAGMKWPVDTLVRLGYVKNDSDKELTALCIPTQSIDRQHRGVDLTIQRHG